MVAVVNRIAEAVSIPVTADMEAGYGSGPDEIADMACEIVSAGAVGLNLEDSLYARPGSLVEVSLTGLFTKP